MNNEPTLDLLILESHSTYVLVVADISQYPTSFNISTPTIEITPPGYITESITFVAKSIQIYNSEMLGIICDGSCETTPLPDGIYKIRYSVYPSYKYNVTKSFLKVDQLLEKFDKAWLKTDTLQCDLAVKTDKKKMLDNIWSDINGAIASANNCMDKQAMDIYRRAETKLSNFLSC